MQGLHRLTAVNDNPATPEPYLAFGLADRLDGDLMIACHYLREHSREEHFGLRIRNVIGWEAIDGATEGRAAVLVYEAANGEGMEIGIEGRHLDRLTRLLTTFELTLLQRFNPEVHAPVEAHDPIIHFLAWRPYHRRSPAELVYHPDGWHDARYLTVSRL